MPTYFLDTGYLVALELSRDQNHAVAVDHWDRLRRSQPSLVTTEYVFAEVVTFLNSRGHHSKAVEVGHVLLQSPSIHFVYVDEQLFGEAWRFFLQQGDKMYSLTDCVSFVVMRQRGIDLALSTDNHFIQAGFRTEPDFISGA